MVFTISAAALFGIVLALMLRFRAVTFSVAAVAALFGFYLASTGIAPAVNDAVVSLFRTLTALH
ncbi:hypothetical protein [Kitasatospora griseola]|uniref:hypothetical protein n=1 Tax=Kitasatospora griseola TaxID=2064 RepID=UPI001670D064|nr:hypothetical protein [Kitasatospora griseola]GGQ66224.1 hypothetical protein GCM10010195_22380 [Kitasatospora griseola]